MYLFAAVLSYFLNAGVYIADKFLLSRRVHSSIVYAFYVGIWSIGNFILLAFAPYLPSWHNLLLDIAAGILFLFTLVFWYKALHQSEATRVVPIVGALTPVFSFLFSYLFLGSGMSWHEVIASILLIIGGLLISIKRTPLHKVRQTLARCAEVAGHAVDAIKAEARPASRLILNSVISAACFAAYYVFIKYIYSHTGQPFIGAFVWSRLGSFIGVLAILLIPSWRTLIKSSETRVHRTPLQLMAFLGVRLAAAAAFLMLNWAVSLGNVSLINALQGAQYAFLLLIVIILSHKFPKIICEEIGEGVIVQKSIGVILVGIGLYLLVI